MKMAPGKVIHCALLLFTLLLSPLVLAAEKKLAAVTVTSATAILPLGQSRDTQLLFTLSNNSTKPLVLTSITSTQVEKIHWAPLQSQSASWTIVSHQQLIVDGKKRHLQLQGLKQSISNGDELLFELGFSDGSSLLLVAKARSAYDQIHGH